ncbi:hypothetical protein V8F06_013023 [Rhypophila decipiens]
MYHIYQLAAQVEIWLGPDNEAMDGKAAISAINAISDFLCSHFNTPISDLGAKKDIYQQVIFANRSVLPLPSKLPISIDDDAWKSLVWLYSHPYYTRVWVIQELNACRNRIVHCGFESTEWARVELVAGYIIMESSSSRAYGFSKAHCWWAAIATTERIRQPDNWLFMLYLTSNFSSTDSRDAIYGLLGLINPPGKDDGDKTLTDTPLDEPDYNKSTQEVYRDSVETALSRFETTDVLLYATGNEAPPTWIPRWDKPMLFRNPFRFGKALPWKPAGDNRQNSKAAWSIDKSSNVLSLSGIVVEPIRFVQTYNEICFCNSTMDSEEGRRGLSELWRRIMETVQNVQPNAPFDVQLLTALEVAFSFGLDEKSDPADEQVLLRNFVSYLQIVLEREMFERYIPAHVTKYAVAGHGDGHAFGKPVWDFKYPESTFFITDGGLLGCSVCIAAEGDIVCAPMGSTYPMILRPEEGGTCALRGFSFVHGHDGRKV